MDAMSLDGNILLLQEKPSGSQCSAGTSQIAGLTNIDNSNYETILYKNINEEIVYQRKIEEKENIIPNWFEYLISFEVPIAKANLSKGWQIIGVIEILNNKNNAYNNLYNLFIKLSLYISITIITFLFLLILSLQYHRFLK